ncbi:MAG: LytTR family DNA-binding domain-containing protein [Lachnospiraceae bacterium]|nr:LytTR family DNA-binding domain-containing protein [Lachnospiraceae bacterium]
MRIALCDDIKRYNLLMERLFTHFFTQQKISNYEITSYTSGIDLLRNITSSCYDLILLDVDMPHLDGFQTAEQIRQVDSQIDLVFATNMQDQVQRGFDYHAKGYLYKEVNQEQINILLNRLLTERKQRKKNNYPVRLIGERADILLDLTKILYFEIHNRDIYGITENETFAFRGEIKKLEEDLKNKGFLRTHRSYLVNINKIFKKLSNYIVLHDGKEIPISKKYQSIVKGELKSQWS